MLIDTPEGEYNLVIEENDRKEEYLAVYDGIKVIAKVHAAWQVAMVRKVEDLEAELELAMVLEESHLRTIKEYSEENATIGDIHTIMEESVFKMSEEHEKALDKSVDEADNKPERRLICNKARCNKCKDVIVSTHRHDFKWCKCGGLFVDGGLAYLRRGGSELEHYSDLSEYEDM